ncbi:MAG: DNA-directed RNA polymerase subunit beta [Dehalococcoidia bacterium]|nr:DNA-directed RNA polymerase subunit beta [Dehalococcoidia bacterium]
MPNLIDIVTKSYESFLESDLRELFDEISPISDFTGNHMDLTFKDYRLEPSKYTEDEARIHDATYAYRIFVNLELLIKQTGEIKEQEIFVGEIPMMTEQGTFIVNGAERVVVSQLVRSPGVYFTSNVDQVSGKRLASGKLIPNRGAWLEFETSTRDWISVKIDRKRKIPITIFLKALDYDPNLQPEELGTAERIREIFKQPENEEIIDYIDLTLARDGTENREEALIEFYKRMRPGDPPSVENAIQLIETSFFSERRYDLGRVGRYKLNQKLGFSDDQDSRTLSHKDIIEIIKTVIEINLGNRQPDDIDHLSNRRVRSVGELLRNQIRIGLLRLERVIKERMTITDVDEATPSSLINIRPVVASIKEFFGSSQLSQFMDQVNPLAEIAHKRRLSALGPGGLSRDRAGFDVRDVHHSHYGRICPIETPEGPNIGLIGNLATYGMVNDFGFIETPYRPVKTKIKANSKELIGRIVVEDIKKNSKILVKKTQKIDADIAKNIKNELGNAEIKVMPFASVESMLMDAHEEDEYSIAPANTKLDPNGNIMEDKVEVRHGADLLLIDPIEIDFIDVSPKQIVSVAAALIPFLEHDDANRALMGANMQRQAVPLIRAEPPLVGTGMETQAARDSGQVIVAKESGKVLSASSNIIKVQYESGEEEQFALMKFVRTNQGTCINQRPVISKGQEFFKGDLLADSSSTRDGELALGQSALVAFMSWEGYNYEDAIILSESIIREDKFSSIHIEKYEIEARDTKLGPEEITRDIPNIGEDALSNLDETGVIRIGAAVTENDILVGKITPKGETELTPEEKLLRAIFGEKAREVKDTSLRVPHGEKGTVTDVKIFNRKETDDLPSDVNEMIKVSVAHKRKITAGDKMAGRHGNKGVVSKIVSLEDMPYQEDGAPVEIILNPIGVPSRMNIGQIYETHLGLAANTLGYRAITPVFDGAKDLDIQDQLGLTWLVIQSEAITPNKNMNEDIGGNIDKEKFKEYLSELNYKPSEIIGNYTKGIYKRIAQQVWLEQRGKKNVRDLDDEALNIKTIEISKELNEAAPVMGKVKLFNGKSGEPFDQPVTVGYIYMMKLIHLVDDKIHARSTGPYSLITQQPLGGKAQFGGQRFGEMEVWALEAYGAANVLQEMLTVKSDDIVGRVKTYESIVKGNSIIEPGVPESFKVLVKELQSLGLSVEVLNEAQEKYEFDENYIEAIPKLGINLSGRELGDNNNG